jgi:sterol 3beta-glucosyltransferase
MRAGTQTLIQALQALPWAEEQDMDEDTHHDVTPTEPESDEDDNISMSAVAKILVVENDIGLVAPLVSRMASSIHTIYRPLARSRRNKIPATRSKHRKLPSVSDAEDEPTPEEPVMSEEELEEDFEPMDRHAPDPKQGRLSPTMSLSLLPELALGSASKSHPTRSGSMATVKLQRRARLAEKLKDVFDVQGIQEVIAGDAGVLTVLLLS